MVLVQNVLPQNVLHYKTSFLQNVLPHNVLPQNFLPLNVHLYKTPFYTKRTPLPNVLPTKHPSLQNVFPVLKQICKNIVSAYFYNILKNISNMNK